MTRGAGLLSMNSMLLNVAVFGAFYAIAYSHHLYVHGRNSSADEAHRAASFFAVAAHPAFIDAVKDFIVHVVVYSGHVIPQHG